jgi:tetratricopeptide (TPR) repeat protein
VSAEEDVKRAIEMVRKEGPSREFNLYLQKLRQEDFLAYSAVKVYLWSLRNQCSQVIKGGTRLLPKVSDRPWLAWHLFTTLSIAYRIMGEMETAEAFLHRALEVAALIGDTENIARTRLQICVSRFLRGEYEQAYKDFLNYNKDPAAWQPHMAVFFWGYYPS